MRSSTADKVQVGPPQIQTAEDARMAYLREEIDESELKEILAKFGHTLEPSNLGLPHPNNFERVDDGFRRSLPDVPEPNRYLLDARLEDVETKEKQREAATKALPEPEFKASSSVPIIVDPNQKPREAAEKVAADRARAGKGTDHVANRTAAKSGTNRSSASKVAGAAKKSSSTSK